MYVLSPLLVHSLFTLMFSFHQYAFYSHPTSDRASPKHRFGANLTIEEEKVEFPNGKENLQRYEVRSCVRTL